MLHDWDKLRIFHLTAKAGSLTRAGLTLGLSQSAVSRQIAELEAQMGVMLFNRHARGLILTEQGEILAATARDMFQQVKTAEMQLGESSTRPSGVLRVTTTMALGAMWLTPMLPEFYARYPDIQLNLILSDGVIDTNLREADVALSSVPLRRHDIIRRSLMPVAFRAYAHESYLAKRGMAENLADLGQHDLIAFPYETPAPSEYVNWLLEANMPPGQVRPARLMVNSYQAILCAIRLGLGIGAIPDYLGRGQAGLVSQLNAVPAPRIEVFLSYPAAFRKSSRVAVFRDFLLEKIASV